VEKFFSSSTTQIVAAAFIAVFSGVVVGQITKHADITVSDDGSPPPDRSSIIENADVPPVTAVAPAISETLPTEPDPTLAQSPVSPQEDSGKFANVAPDKAPRRNYEPRTLPGRAPTPAEKKPTHVTTDQTVLHVRRLQTQLMVGALSCGQPHMQTSYNSFVSKFDRALKANGAALKSYFIRQFGARGTSEMDSFLTKLSNELSLVSMRHGDFCQRTDGLFESVLALGPSDIEAFADRYLTQPMVARDGF
jgi:hypothetical protein